MRAIYTTRRIINGRELQSSNKTGIYILHQFLPCELSSNATPVTDTIKTAATIIYTPPVSITTEDNTEKAQSNTFMELLNYLPEWKKETLQSVEYHLDKEEI
eukprot:4012327-Ditylum_brightwellii.AAC.1